MKDPENAWQIEARRSYDEHGGDYQQWRRVVATKWLIDGDTRPVQELLQEGAKLGDELSYILAVAMDPEHHEISTETLPFELKNVRRVSKPGPMPDREMETYREEIADRIKSWMDHGSSFDGAIATVLEEQAEAGYSFDTFRLWYKDRHGRIARAKKGAKPAE